MVDKLINPTPSFIDQDKEKIEKLKKEKDAARNNAILNAIKQADVNAPKRFEEAKTELAATPITQIQRVSAPSAAQVERIDAPQAATLGQAGEDIRRQQQSLLGGLVDRAEGRAPSVAEQQLKANIERTLAAQSAAASTAGTALAQRQAAIQGQQAMQEASQQGAILAAQERERAQQAALQAAGQVRGQDISRAGTEAQLQQQAALTGAQLAVQQAGQQAGLEQEAGLTGARLAQQANLAQAQIEEGRAQQLNDLIARYMQQGLNMDQAKIQAEVAMRGQDIGLSKSREAISSQEGIARRGRTDRLLGGLISGVAGIGAAAISDERAKENITEGKADVEAFLDALSAKNFDYKPGIGDKGQTGIMAQDLEKSKVGQTMVGQTEDGIKAVKVEASLGPILASLAELNERTKKLKKK